MLVLRPGALGDALLAVPALRALRRAFQPLTLATNAAAARLLAALGEVDNGLAFDDTSLTWLFSGNADSEEPIVAWMNTPLMRAKVVAPSRPSKPEHCARYLLRTLAPLGINLDWDDRPLDVTLARSDEFLIHAGSGSAAKNWPAIRFAEVIGALDGPVRLVVGEADLVPAAAVEAELGRELPHLETPPLLELAERLAGCRAYLGNDSGVSHLAGLCGARTIAMFGPSDPTIWQPIGPDIHVLPFDADVGEVLARLTGAVEA